MSTLVSLLTSIAGTIGGILVVFGGAVTLMGWYDDRPDNVTRGLWIIGTGVAMSGLAGIAGKYIDNLTATAPSQPAEPDFGKILSPSSISDIKAKYKTAEINAFILWVYDSIILVAKIPAEALNYIAKYTANGIATNSSIGDILMPIGMGFYSLFALTEVANQYKRISNMGGSDLSSFGVPIQLIFRIGIPLVLLDSKVLQGIYSLIAYILSASVGWGETLGTSLSPTGDLGRDAELVLEQQLAQQSFVTNILFSVLVIGAAVMAFFAVARSLGLIMGVGIRVIGYAAALPIALASFACEDFQDIGRNELKGLLSSALQGLFIAAGIFLTIQFATILSEGLFKNKSFLYNILGIFILSFSMMAGAEEGNALGKEVFR